jgi:hypothetical protein
LAVVGGGSPASGPKILDLSVTAILSSRSPDQGVLAEA